MSSPDVVIRIDRKGLVLVAALVLVGAGAGLLWSESLTLVTTYPSPSGIYNQLVTTGNSGTVPADTTLNRNAGNTLLVPATNPGGMVGIGMAPVNKFDVAGNASFTGSVKLGDDNAACTPTKEGTLKWRRWSSWNQGRAFGRGTMTVYVPGELSVCTLDGGWVRIWPPLAQRWVDVTGSRAAGVSYVNDTPAPIHVKVSMYQDSANRTMAFLSVDGAEVDGVFSFNNPRHTLSVVVPPGSTYRLRIEYGSIAPNILYWPKWYELR